VQNQTVAEKLAEDERNVKITKMVSKRFPDAIMRADRWVSESVTSDNATGVEPYDLTTNGCKVELYCPIKFKGDFIRVYGPKRYPLTADHVCAVLRHNAKTFLKEFGSVLRTQESKPRPLTWPRPLTCP